MVLIAIAAIFIMLCERTAGMLSSLMNAEEQERMIEEMRLVQKKSEETSRMLMGMVKELSHITESSMESMAKGEVTCISMSMEVIMNKLL